MMMMTFRNIAKIASSRDFTDHISRSFVVLKKNHVTEMDDLRYQIWPLGAVGRLIFFVSSSQNHSRRLWVSLTYKDHLPDWTRKSNRTTTTSSFASNLDSMPRLVYLRRATSRPNFDNPTSSKSNLANLRRRRNSSEQLNTGFRERTRSAIAKAAGEDISRFSEKTNISVVRINRIFDSGS